MLVIFVFIKFGYIYIHSTHTLISLNMFSLLMCPKSYLRCRNYWIDEKYKSHICNHIWIQFFLWLLSPCIYILNWLKRSEKELEKRQRAKLLNLKLVTQRAFDTSWPSWQFNLRHLRFNLDLDRLLQSIISRWKKEFILFCFIKALVNINS